MNKRFLSLLLIVSLSLPQIGSFTTITSVNNTDPSFDYKANCSNLFSKIKESDVKTFTVQSERECSIDDLRNYLLETNIIDRVYSIHIRGSDITCDKAEPSYKSLVDRSDALVVLYKALYGTLESRPIVMEQSDTELKTLINPNVYELYLAKLLEKNIISESNLFDKELVLEINNYLSFNETQPQWSNNIPVTQYVNKDNLETLNGIFGKSYDYKLGFFKNKYDITQKDTYTYFVSEDISKLEFYDYVYELLFGITQPDLMEVQIETIKYQNGNAEINNLDELERNKLYYLMQEGIMDPSSSEECSALDSGLTIELLYKYAYRLHAEQNRLSVNFKELTTDDSNLAKQGFQSQTCNIVDVPRSIRDQTLVVAKTSEIKPAYEAKSSKASEEEETESTGFFAGVNKVISNGLSNAKKDAINLGHFVYNNTIARLTGGEQLDYFETNIVHKDDSEVEVSGPTYGEPIEVTPTDIDEEDEAKSAEDTTNSNEESTEASDDNSTRVVDGVTVSGSDTSNEGTESNIEENTDDSNKDKSESTSTSGKGTTSDKEVYKIIKVFPAPDLVTFKGKKLSEVSNDSNISSTEETSGGLKVEFKVSASSHIEALAVIDSKINYDLETEATKKLQTITKVSNSKGSVSYISAKELERTFGEVVVISNKVLKNKVTGDTAVLLSQNHAAMVGNRIIRSDDPICITNTEDTYYNMSVIAQLMSNAYISELDPSKLFITDDLPKETVTQVTCSGIELEKTLVMSNQEVKGSYFSGEEYYFNLDLVSRGITCLTRKFVVNGKPVYVIVDWAYSLPNNDNTIIDMFKQTDFSVKDASEFLFTRPDSGIAQEWWDNNLELSNALANVMYGTKNVTYITSGYLKPDVFILASDDSLKETSVIKGIFKNLNLSSSYLKKYCNGSLDDFQINLFGGSGDLTGRRTFSYILGKEKNGCTVYDNMFITSPTGSIYKNINQDSRMLYEDNQLKVTGRDTTAKDVSYNTEVDVNGDLFYLQAPTNETFTQYYCLTSVVPVWGKAVKDRAGVYNLQKLDEPDVNPLAVDIANILDKLKSSALELHDDEYIHLANYTPTQYSKKVDAKYYRNGGTYLYDGKVASNDISTLKPGLNENPSSYQQTTMNTSSVMGFSTIYLSRSHFTIENGKLIRRNSVPYLEQGNLFFSGLNSTLISRLIDNQVSVISYSDLPIGSKVIIQDTLFHKTTFGLESAPIADSSLARTLSSFIKSPSDITKTILGRFTGLQVYFSGRPVSFTSYIKKATLGNFQDGDSPNNTLYTNGNNAQFISSEGTRDAWSGQSPDSVCINIDLDDSIQFYLLDAETRTYAIKYSTDKYSDGYIDSISIWNEDLGFGVADDIFLELHDNVFKPMDNFRGAFEEYKNMYHSMLKGDIIATLRFIMTIIISYMIITSWICTAILCGGLGLSILLVLRNPSGVKGKEGLDLIKIFSLGIWNLDSKPNIGMVFVANIILFVLLRIVINCGNIITKMFY